MLFVPPVGNPVWVQCKLDSTSKLITRTLFGCITRITPDAIYLNTFSGQNTAWSTSIDRGRILRIGRAVCGKAYGEIPEDQPSAPSTEPAPKEPVPEASKPFISKAIQEGMEAVQQNAASCFQLPRVVIAIWRHRVTSEARYTAGKLLKNEPDKVVIGADDLCSSTTIRRSSLISLRFVTQVATTENGKTRTLSWRKAGEIREPVDWWQLNAPPTSSPPSQSQDRIHREPVPPQVAPVSLNDPTAFNDLLAKAMVGQQAPSKGGTDVRKNQPPPEPVSEEKQAWEDDPAADLNSLLTAESGEVKMGLRALVGRIMRAAAEIEDDPEDSIKVLLQKHWKPVVEAAHGHGDGDVQKVIAAWPDRFNPWEINRGFTAIWLKRWNRIPSNTSSVDGATAQLKKDYCS